MTRILVAPNAFKGCLTAAEAAREIAAGVRRAAPGAAIDLMPVSDGGDGLMDVLIDRLGGRRVSRSVIGPLGRPKRAAYALLSDGRTAVIEMARASGIAGLKRSDLDPLGATSFGTGQLIADALSRGAKKLVIGMGGSATNDGGAGMAEALGARFVDARGGTLARGAGPLVRLACLDMSDFASLKGISVVAVSDVRNPLLGPLGSARVYGPQKGASPEQVRLLSRALEQYARVLKACLGKSVGRVPGGGAAGGLGAGLLAFLGAKLVPGAEWVLDALGADRRLKGADLVLSGEGRLDEQSFFGKAPVTLADRARKRGARVGFLCGQVSGTARRKVARNGQRAYSLSLPGESVEQAMRGARARLRRAAERAVRDAGLALLLGLAIATPTIAQAPAAPEENSIAKADDLYFHRNAGDNLARATKMLLALLEAKPDDAQVLWRVGRATSRTGELLTVKKEKIAAFQRAEEYLKKSIELDPKIAEAHFWLGAAMGRRGQTAGIMKSLFLVKPIRIEMNATLALEPKHSGAHHVLGEMLRHIPGFAGGSKKGAVEEMEKALEANPNNTALHCDAANAYLAVGAKEKAVEVLKKMRDVKAPADPAEFEEDLAAADKMLRKLEGKD
ncbi:MAG: glycerate kinase [Elusimicrobia bacterium]|nr:glycerate kinase [Elusimicrobiota bacterium]